VVSTDHRNELLVLEGLGVDRRVPKRPWAAPEVVGPSPQVGQTVCADDPGYGLEQAQPITSGLLAALRVLHQRV